MNDFTTMINKLKELFPLLFIIFYTDDNIIFGPEQHDGYIEYKRKLLRDNKKIENYATQMQWRISENIKRNFAIYYIGLDDSGKIIGLNFEEIVEYLNIFILSATSVNISIKNVQIICIKNIIIIKICIKKKNKNKNEGRLIDNLV